MSTAFADWRIACVPAMRRDDVEGSLFPCLAGDMHHAGSGHKPVARLKTKTPGPAQALHLPHVQELDVLPGQQMQSAGCHRRDPVGMPATAREHPPARQPVAAVHLNGLRALGWPVTNHRSRVAPDFPRHRFRATGARRGEYRALVHAPTGTAVGLRNGPHHVEELKPVDFFTAQRARHQQPKYAPLDQRVGEFPRQLPLRVYSIG